MKRLLLLIVCAVSFAGCLYKDEPGDTPEGTTPAATDDAAKTDDGTAASTETTGATPTPNASAQTTTTPAPETIQKKADVGLTGKGNYGSPGIFTTPISAYFKAAERLTLDNMAYAMKLYQAEHGTFPKSHDEFMEVIIKANNIQLPKLPPGHKYVYDPETHTLMVEQPK